MSGNRFIIAVMGVTGAGKSSFIQSVTGRSDIKIGQGLSTETGQVKSYEFSHEGTDFTLVDTPGFDDSREPDEKIIDEIIRWLDLSSKKGTKLNGLIYLHRIIDPRMPGSAKASLRMFRSLCGPQNFQNVVLATTSWDKVTESEGQKTENELKTNREYCGLMVAKGSRVERINTDRASNLQLLMSLARENKQKVVLEAQREMVEGKDPSETAAAQLVNADVMKLKMLKFDALCAQHKTMIEQKDHQNRLNFTKQKGRADHEHVLQKIKAQRAIREATRKEQRAKNEQHSLERRHREEEVSAISRRLEVLHVRSQDLTGDEDSRQRQQKKAQLYFENYGCAKNSHLLDWMEHYRIAESSANGLPGLLHQIIILTGDNHPPKELLTFDRKFESFQLGLEICILHNFKVLGQTYLEMGADASSIGMISERPLIEIAAEKSPGMIELLTQYGAKFDGLRRAKSCEICPLHEVRGLLVGQPSAPSHRNDYWIVLRRMHEMYQPLERSPPNDGYISDNDSPGSQTATPDDWTFIDHPV